MSIRDEPDDRPRCDRCHNTTHVVETSAEDRAKLPRSHYCTACDSYFGTVAR